MAGLTRQQRAERIQQQAEADRLLASAQRKILTDFQAGKLSKDTALIRLAKLAKQEGPKRLTVNVAPPNGTTDQPRIKIGVSQGRKHKSFLLPCDVVVGMANTGLWDRAVGLAIESQQK
jgi:hypothetical protein